MRLFGASSFTHHGTSNFPTLNMQAYILCSSCSLFSSCHSSASYGRRSLTLRSTIATNRVVVVSRAARSFCSEPDPDREGQNPSNRRGEKQEFCSSSSEGNPSSSGGNGGNPSSPGGNGGNPSSSGGNGANPSSTSCKGNGANLFSSGGNGFNPLSSGGNCANPSSSGGNGSTPSSSGGNGANPSPSEGNGAKPSSKGNGANASSSKSNGANLSLSKNNGTNNMPALTGDQLHPNPFPSFKDIKYMAKGIEAASRVVKGWKVIRKLQGTPPEGALLVGFGAGSGVVMGLKAAKLLAKGLKVSEKILASLHSSNVVLKGRVGGAIVEKRIQEKLTSIAKGFNAVYGAVMVVQFSKSFGSQLQVAKLLDWNSFLKGYKLSKSFLSVLDAVIGKEFGVFATGFLVIKKIVGGVGIIVKAASLSKEICVAVLKRLAIPEGTIAAAFGANFHGKHRQAPIDGSHQNKLKRMLCITPNEGTLSPLLLVLLPSSPVRNQSFSLFVFLAETSQNACVHHLEEDDLFGIFSLAIPMPTSEILVLV